MMETVLSRDNGNHALRKQQRKYKLETYCKKLIQLILLKYVIISVKL